MSKVNVDPPSVKLHTLSWVDGMIAADEPVVPARHSTGTMSGPRARAVTADTITDEQIRELRVVQPGEVLYTGIRMSLVNVALGLRRPRRGDSKRRSRVRCAEIVNARETKAP